MSLKLDTNQRNILSITIINIYPFMYKLKNLRNLIKRNFLMPRYRKRQTLVTDKNVKPANYSSEWKIEIKKKHFCPIDLTAECIACNHRGWNRYRSFVLVLSWQAAHLCLRSLLAAGLTQPPLLSRFCLGLDFKVEQILKGSLDSTHGRESLLEV